MLLAEGLSRSSYTGAQFRSCLRDILSASGWRRLEVWEWGSVRKAWRCGKTASPGNTDALDGYFEGGDASASGGDISLSSAPVVVALVQSGDRIGLAYADAVALSLGLAEFTDNDLLSNVEIALIQLGAVECIVPSALGSLDKIRDICKNCGIAMNPVKGSEFGGEGAASELAKLMTDDQFAALEHPELGLRAALGLASYLRLLGSDSNLKAFKFLPYHPDSYLKLDDTALRSLHVFPSAGQGGSSLYSLLNQCRTGQGSRMLNQWLRQPLRSQEAIEARLDAVEAFVEGAEVRQGMRETGLRALPDLARILRRLLRASANLQDIVVLYQVAARIPALIQELSTTAPSHQHVLQHRYIDNLAALKEQLSPFSEMVERMVDFAALDRHEYLVRADFDEALTEVSQQKDGILGQLEAEFDRVATDLGLEAGKKLKLERNGIHGYFLRVSRLDAGLVKDDSLYQQLGTQKNGLYFCTAHLRDLSLRYDELCRLYASKQSVLVRGMLETAASYRSTFEQLNLVIADMDVCLSLAYVAVMSPKPLVRPAIGGTDLLLRACRHPCVEAQQVDFIANDVEFRRGPDGHPVQLITGPNMGGKSTYIRQAALSVIMAQVGCFVPCDSASLPLFDAVMVRVGAGDNIMRGVSTFMAEMLETASILKTATPDSFVIIDELGRGTSTSEGLGIAWGVTKFIATRISCFTFFATHFHELTLLATQLPALIRNLHVSAAVFQGALTMLYEVRPGVCDQSFGIHVAELARFPPLVVQMARLRNAELEGGPVIRCVGREEEERVAATIQTMLAEIEKLPKSERRSYITDALANAPGCLQEVFSCIL